MRQRSVIAQTGQVWKTYVGLAGATLGVVATILIGITQHRPATQDIGSFIGRRIGVVITFASTLYLCLAVRCPKCGARWVWMALLKWHSPRWLRSLSSCPKCHFSGRAGGKRDRGPT